MNSARNNNSAGDGSDSAELSPSQSHSGGTDKPSAGTAEGVSGADQYSGGADDYSAGADDYSGESLDQRFSISERLGDGASSVVFKAQHRMLNETVVIKVLKNNLLDDKAAVARFKREAKLTMALVHPHIIGLKGFGVSAKGEPFIVMQFSPGLMLDRRLQSSPLSLAETKLLGMQIAEALEYSHSRDIVHRDIKPANILLANADDSQNKPFEAKLLDFGLAKELSPDTNGEPSITQATFALGTPNYMSPEQCAMKPADARSDLYSLACVLFECVTGRKLFIGQSDFAVMNMHINNEAAFADGDKISASFKSVILKCLSKDAAARFQTASEFKEALSLCSVSTKKPLSWASNIAVFIIPMALLVPVIMTVLTLAQHKSDHEATKADHFLSLNQKATSNIKLKRLAKDVDFEGDADDMRHDGNHAETPGPGKPRNSKLAETLLRNAYEISLRQNRQRFAVKCLIDLGTVYLDRADYPRALATFKQADESSIKNKDPNQRIEIYKRWSSLYAKQKDEANALVYAQKALALCSPEEPMRYDLMRVIGDKFILLKEPEQAKKIVTEGNKELAAHDPEEAIDQLLLNELVLAQADLMLGESGKVNKHIESVLRSAKTRHNDELTQRSLDLAQKLLDTKQYDSAFKLTSSIKEFAGRAMDADNHETTAARSEMVDKILNASRGLDNAKTAH